MENNINITPVFIKNYIEELTGIKLSEKTRARIVVDVRRVAFKLTKELTNASLSSIGRLYDKDHATVLHGIKTFDNLYNSADFRSSKDLYKKIYLSLDMREKIGISRSLKTLEETHIYYEDKIDQIIESHREKVKNIMLQNERFKTNPIFSKIAGLPEKEFRELEVRVNAFLQMNGMNSERRKLRKQRELKEKDIYIS